MEGERELETIEDQRREQLLCNFHDCLVDILERWGSGKRRIKHKKAAREIEKKKYKRRD